MKYVPNDRMIKGDNIQLRVYEPFDSRFIEPGEVVDPSEFKDYEKKVYYDRLITSGDLVEQKAKKKAETTNEDK